MVSLTQNSFTIIEKISEGPTAVVYKARQDALERIVLLKKLQPHLVQDKDAAARFMREAKACALLKSENIVQVYDVIEFENSPSIVMEFVDGTPLDELLKTRGPFDEDFLRQTAKEVLTALENAHSNGVIHRDIKPANIILSNRNIIKVTDFGIAAVASAPSLTTEGNLMGTPAYMSPEQARGESVDGRTDFFSLGVTLIELATGEKIFGGNSYAECLSKILNFNGELPENLSRHLSDNFKMFLSKLIAPNKEHRYATSIEALQKIAGTNGSISHSDEKPTHSYRKTAILTSLTVIVMTAITIFFSNHRKEPDSIGQTNLPTTTSTQKQTTDATELRGQKNDSQKNNAEPSATPEHFPQQLIVRESPVTNTATPSVTTDSGYLAITCVPWGKVFIDNQYIETTPIAGTVKVTSGTHLVTFVNPDFVPLMKTITIKKNMQTSVDANFLEKAGYLFITADPWADIYIDDQHRDTTPLSHPLLASAGKRKIRLHNPAFKDYETTITIVAHDTVRFNYVFDVAKK